MRGFSLFILILLLLSALISCGNDDKFHDTIASLDAEHVYLPYTELTSFADFVGWSEFDVVVRARVKRIETIREPDGIDVYAENFIEDSDREILKTVYSLEPSAVFPSDAEFASRLTIALPYGIDGDSAERSYDLPILRDGCEYLLFLYCEEASDETTEWKLSPSPYSAIRLDKNTFLPESDIAAAIFDEFETVDELTELLENHLRRDEFDEAINNIPLTMHVRFASFDSLERLLTQTNATQIIRCRVARADTVLKPLGGEISDISRLDDPSVGESTKKKLAKSLCTPYVLAVSEVLWSTEEIPDSVILYAPFGIYGEYKSREYFYPILRDGGDYILVLRRESNGEYTLAFTPQVMPILGEDYVTNAYSDGYFGQYKSVAELTNALKSMNV